MIVSKKASPRAYAKQGRTGVFEKVCSRLIEKSQYLKNLSDDEVQALFQAIQPERLTAYVAATPDQRTALALYQYNSAFSSQLMDLTAAFEIVLRNSVSNAIKAHIDRDDWYRARAFTRLLAPERRANIREVRARIETQGHTVRSGRVVAALSFHFWGAMHEGKYRDTLWTPCLRHIWPTGTNVKQLHRDLFKIRDLRNRLAHHEPVFAYKWRKRTPIIWDRLNQLSPEKYAWMQDRVGEDLAASLETLDTFDTPSDKANPA